MEIGMNLPVMVPGLDRDLILEWCQRIDAGPYASLAAGERITFPNPEIMVTLSAAAALTQRVRIFFNVLVLPMHNAVLKAKELATLDLISGGRLTLGVGAGARKEDFRAVDANAAPHAGPTGSRASASDPPPKRRTAPSKRRAPRGRRKAAPRLRASSRAASSPWAETPAARWMRISNATLPSWDPTRLPRSHRASRRYLQRPSATSCVSSRISAPTS